MIKGWISLRVEEPKKVAAWYIDKLGFEAQGERPGIGLAVGTKDAGRAMVLLNGEGLEHPERVQLHFEVKDVDAEYQRLREAGVEFSEPPKDMPWRWRHAYTSDPAGHTVEICSPLPDAHDKDAEFVRSPR